MQALGAAEALQLAAHHVGEFGRLERIQLGGNPGQPARAEGLALFQQAQRLGAGAPGVLLMELLATHDLVSVQADIDVLHVVVVVQGFEEGFDFFQFGAGQADRVLRLVAELG